MPSYRVHLRIYTYRLPRSVCMHTVSVWHLAYVNKRVRSHFARCSFSLLSFLVIFHSPPSFQRSRSFQLSARISLPKTKVVFIPRIADCTDSTDSIATCKKLYSHSTVSYDSATRMKNVSRARAPRHRFQPR